MSKAFDKLVRPELHLIGSWAIGASLHMAVTDENVKKDSDCQIEIMSRTLESVFERSGRMLPLGLHMQADNCSREFKNKYCLRMGILLVLTKVLRWVTFGFLRTGHSHECIDQIFGQVSKHLAAATFSTPDDVVELLERLCRESSVMDSAPKQTQG
eukprot:2588549-Alexandrium_andersonii.AAC.1